MAEDLFASVVQAIKDSVLTHRVALDERIYFSRPVYLPPPESAIDTLVIPTLTGLVDYIDADPDDIDPDFIHVASPTLVHLYTKVQGRDNRRERLVTADCSKIIGKGFGWENWFPVSTMVVSLQSMFAESDDRARLLASLGNVKDERVTNFGDNGVDQLITTKVGTRSGETVVPNPVYLRPYRTFREIEQPLGMFTHRMEQAAKQGEPPKCALFPADGGEWQLTAIASIKEYLAEHCPEIPIIA